MILPETAARVFFDGQYSSPRLHHPEGVAVGPDGAIWCGNAEGDIVRIDRDGRRRRPRRLDRRLHPRPRLRRRAATLRLRPAQRRGLAARRSPPAPSSASPAPASASRTIRWSMPPAAASTSPTASAPTRRPRRLALRPRDRRRRALVVRADALRQRHGAGARRRRALRGRDLRPQGQPHRHRRRRPPDRLRRPRHRHRRSARRHRPRRRGRSLHLALPPVADPARPPPAGSRSTPRIRPRTSSAIRPTSPSTGRCSSPPTSAAGTSPRSTTDTDGAAAGRADVARARRGHDRSLRGITWDHPRGYQPLAENVAAFTALHPEIEVSWSRRSPARLRRAAGGGAGRDLRPHRHRPPVLRPGAGHRLPARPRPALPRRFLRDARARERRPGDPLLRLRRRRSGACPPTPPPRSRATAPTCSPALDAAPPRTADEVLALGRKARRAGKWLALPSVASDAACLVATLVGELGRPIREADDRHAPRRDLRPGPRLPRRSSSRSATRARPRAIRSRSTTRWPRATRSSTSPSASAT